MEAIYFIIIAILFISQINGETAEKTCQVQTNVLQSDVKNYQEFKLPQTREGKCYGACVMKSVSIINSQGKIIPRRAEQIARNYIKTHGQLDKAEDAIKKCSLPANRLRDECETAYFFMKCLSTLSNQKLAARTITISPPSIQLPPVTLVLFQLSVL